MKTLALFLFALFSFPAFAQYTNVQIGQGFIRYDYKDYDAEYKTSEKQIRPTISLQISGVITEKNQNLWFDLFTQYSAPNSAEYDYGQGTKETQEQSLRFMGAGLKLTTNPNSKMFVYGKAGRWYGKYNVDIKEKDEFGSYNENYVTDVNGHYVGTGLGFRFTDTFGMVVDHIAVKDRRFDFYLHTIQTGFNFYF